MPSMVKVPMLSASATTDRYKKLMPTPTATSALIDTKLLMVTALGAIGLGTSITDFRKAGFAPMLYGITIDTLVTLTALAVIWGMGLL